MPYSGPNDPSIPDHVPAGKRAQWVAVFNRTLSACQKEGGEECEGRAFKMANGVIKAQREDRESKQVMSTQVIIEQTGIVEGTFNPEERQVRQRIIVAGWSQNGRYYAPNVLQKAAGLFEGARVYADHPSRQDVLAGKPRRVGETAGWLKDVKFENGQLVATRFFTQNQAGRDSMALAEDVVNGTAPAHLFGGSINAIGKTRAGTVDGKEGAIVEAIEAVNSVDDVSTPAAGGGFEPLLHSGDELTVALLAALTEEEWRAARPEFVDRLKKEWQVVRQTEAVTAANTERDQAKNALVEVQNELKALHEKQQALEAELARLRAENVRKAAEVQLEVALREAKLPMEWEKQLREQLQKAQPEQWPGIVAAERVKAGSGTRAGVPVLGAPQRTAAPAVVERPRTGPIYLGEDATPDDLIAELARRRH